MSRNVYANKNPKGFTLLEVLVVIFILGLLVAIVAPKIIGRTDDAKITEAKVQIRNFQTALKMYKLDNGVYPTTDQGLDALIHEPATEPIPKKYRQGGYLENNKIPLDPWENPYIYASPGLNNDIEILSLGSDGQEGGDGINSDIESWNIEK
ncbi:general secretion pathway protein G [Candidatus Magnetoovum chiemensis]|nr:general secretion pathway protein G [Candidatus Magnetoovum chiemensis]